MSDEMITALAVLVDKADDDGLAVRAAALDAALRHVAGDGCARRDGDGSGTIALEVAGRFETYLTGTAAVVGEHTLALLVADGFLADLDAAARLARSVAVDGARADLVEMYEGLAKRLQAASERLDPENAPAGGR